MGLFSRFKLFMHVRRYLCDEKSVVVRFAPSPTGFLHLGGARTAFFNKLFAASFGSAKFLVRIEDTDQNRVKPESLQALYEDLAWLDLQPDEEPLVQSTRLSHYQEAVNNLLASGHAYRCFCSQERLDLMRKTFATEHGFSGFKYDRRCKDLSSDEVSANLLEGVPSTIRFVFEPDFRCWHDAIQGPVTSTELPQHEGDPIIMKADGFPTYHLANVVDDLASGVTHVFRGAEWFVSTPKHLAIRHALTGCANPTIRYGHLPLLRHSSGVKLSKRDASLSIRHMRDHQGFVSEGIKTFLAHSLGLTSTPPASSTDLLTAVKKCPRRIDADFFRKVNQQAIAAEVKKDPESILDWVLNKASNEQMWPRDIQLRGLQWAFSEGQRKDVATLSDVLNKSTVSFLFDDFHEDDQKAQKLTALTLKCQTGLLKVAEQLRTSNSIDLQNLYDNHLADIVTKAEWMIAIRWTLIQRKTGPPAKDLFKIIGHKRSASLIDNQFPKLSQQSF